MKQVPVPVGICLMFLSAAVVFGDVAKPELPDDTRLPQSENGSFVLYVSNQSLAFPLVDITIRIDGKVAVRDEFHVSGGRIPQHNRFRYIFDLHAGPHTISVVSEKGDAVLREEIEIVRMHWATVDFAYDAKGDNRKSIRFNISDAPIALE